MDIKYIGMDVHKETISIAVMKDDGRLVMESIIETKASTILQFIHGVRGDLHVTFEEGTWATWLYDLLKPIDAFAQAAGVSVWISDALRAGRTRSSHLPYQHDGHAYAEFASGPLALACL